MKLKLNKKKLKNLSKDSKQLPKEVTRQVGGASGGGGCGGSADLSCFYME